MFKTLKKYIKLILTCINHIFMKLRYGFNRIGKNSFIHNPLRVHGGCYISIGDRTVVINGIRIEAISQWNKVKYNPKIEIGNDVNIGQCCHFTSANRIKIGNGVSIMPNVLVTDIEHIYEKDRSINETGLDVGSVDIGDYTTIGMGCRILGHRGVRIGKNVVIGTNTVIKQDIPDNSIAYGNPLKIVRRTYRNDKI